MEIVIMSLESSELTIGGQTFKGAWIAVVLAIGSTITKYSAPRRRSIVDKTRIRS